MAEETKLSDDWLAELESAHTKAKELSERAEREGRIYLAIDMERVENILKTLADAERRSSANSRVK